MDGAAVASDVDCFPTAYTAAMAELARADAEIVGRWLLDNLGASVVHQELTSDFILGVALSLKFCQWEVRGIRAHLEAGLPSGPQLLSQVFALRDAATLGEMVTFVGAEVARLSYEGFLWAIEQVELRAFSLAIQADLDEELLLEAVANYLTIRVGGTCP